MTDGYTDCSPWFRPLKSLQSSETNMAFRQKLSNKNVMSYSWSYPPLNCHYKMTLISQQFWIFKKCNGQKTIFILELTWLKNTLVSCRCASKCIVNSSISQSVLKRKRNKKNNEYSYDCWQAEKFKIEKLLLLISFSRNQKSFLKIIKLPVFIIIIIIIIIIIMALALTKSSNFI